MIETIHKKEVTTEETTKKQNLVFKMPKNIKQIGKTGQNPEIYIEDYAESYLRRLSECDYTECRAAVLVGEVVQLEKNRVMQMRDGSLILARLLTVTVTRTTVSSLLTIFGRIEAI